MNVIDVLGVYGRDVTPALDIGDADPNAMPTRAAQRDQYSAGTVSTIDSGPPVGIARVSRNPDSDNNFA